MTEDARKKRIGGTDRGHVRNTVLGAGKKVEVRSTECRVQTHSPVFKVQAGEQARPCPLFLNRKLVLPVTSALQSVILKLNSIWKNILRTILLIAR